MDDAEHAHLVASDAGHRTPRYEFVHELIRTTLVSGLSIPRRQRLHLKIADAVERLRAASLDSHASVLAHHLYQAGAAADVQRTARVLALAARRALAAGAFEEALETCDHLIGLELADEDPLLAEAFEHRGAALVALQRADEAVAALERALALSTARRDDAGIARAAQASVFCFVLLGRFPEARCGLASWVGCAVGRCRAGTCQPAGHARPALCRDQPRRRGVAPCGRRDGDGRTIG